MRILIVEDDVDSGEALLHLLDDLGHEVQLVHSPILAQVVATEFRPELAILDIGLPFMSGYGLAAALSAIPQLEGCRYVALTGFEEPSLPEDLSAAGFERHFTKPLVFAELKALLDPAFARPPLALSVE